MNEHPDVSEELRSRILSLVQETGYTPHLGARGLRLSKTYTIGFVFPQITNEFFLEVALSLERIARDNGYSVVMGSTEETPESEREAITVLVSKRVDGIVVVSVGTTGALLGSVVERHHIPIVLIGNRVEGLRADAVLQDNSRGAQMLTSHLIEHGHKTIAYVTGPRNNSSSQERFGGFRSALADRRLLFDANLLKETDWTYRGGYGATVELLGRSPGNRPTAIFYANANTAIGGLRAMRRLGIRVPADIAIVSFENISITEMVTPTLTTLNNVGHRLGQLSYKLLHERMSEKARGIRPPVEKVINAKLCIRESCGCNQ